MASIVSGSAHPAVTQGTSNPSSPAAMAVALTDGEGRLLRSTDNGDGTWSLASGATVPLVYPPQARTGPNTGDSFFTVGYSSVAIDINVTTFTGGSSPSVTFFLNRLGGDGLWYPIWTSGAINTTKQLSASLGPGQSGGSNGAGGFPAVLTTQAQFGWTYAGSPTSVTFSGSVASRG
ncbi:hypothetical protein AB0N17_02950 [Streptomyces sp. NPDC051133]|uniref:hypothetical protein n=1 Tax=Streptomyces sp. NPDC051133 TaxID=3155521 RepID=UPI0034199C23